MAYQQATMFRTLQLTQDTTAEYESMKEVLKEVKHALAQNVDLTKDQAVRRFASIIPHFNLALH